MVRISALAVPSPFHAPGWYIAAGLLALAAVFHEWIRRSLLAIISAASAGVQDRLAGSVLIRTYAIRRYRSVVLKNYAKLPLAFLTITLSISMISIYRCASSRSGGRRDPSTPSTSCGAIRMLW